jgi:hypothetical protein
MTVTIYPGETFGRLTFLRNEVGGSAGQHIKARWVCACGTEVIARNSHVRRGLKKSCGCLSKELASKRLTKHGGKGTPEYSSWGAMKGRCENPFHKDYPNYGGRGITVCEDWSKSFGAFRDHVGPRPPGKTIGRINTNRGYEPGNVRWEDEFQQARNRRSTYKWYIKGQVFDRLEQAAAVFGVSSFTIWRWVNGEFDSRRGTYTPPKKDCWSEHVY